MNFKIKEESIDIIRNDLNKKYLKSGKRLGGELSENKITLYLEDDFGKHSAFMSDYFYGKITGGEISGKFRAANYVIVLLIILFAVALESIIAAIIFKGYTSVIMPALIIAAEIFYFFYLNKLSTENNELIEKYLLNL